MKSNPLRSPGFLIRVSLVLSLKMKSALFNFFFFPKVGAGLFA